MKRKRKRKRRRMGLLGAIVIELTGLLILAYVISSTTGRWESSENETSGAGEAVRITTRSSL